MVDGTLQTGPQTVRAKDGRLLWQENSYDTLTFAPHSPQSSFTLPEVTIGIGFHWERQEAQTFEGMLRLEADGDRVWVINELPVERYLASVISSEMRATSSPSLLRAHAIISRSWLLTQIAHHINADHPSAETCGGWETEEELVRWYDRDDHQRFDVCADDHCQRYQGITRMVSDHVEEAIHSTYDKYCGTARAFATRASASVAAVPRRFSRPVGRMRTSPISPPSSTAPRKQARRQTRCPT